MSAQHTSGPWMVLPSVDRGQFCILTEHGNRIDIAVTYGFEHQPREANARLIAAAPELLEALDDLTRHCRRMGFDTREEEPLLQAAESAIAKATGSQP